MEHWRTSLAQNFQSVLERAEFDSQLALFTCLQFISSLFIVADTAWVLCCYGDMI